VDLQGTEPAPVSEEENAEEGHQTEEHGAASVAKFPVTLPSTPPTPTAPSAAVDPARAKKVFITHGKNRGLIEPITKLLKFGELEAVVSVQSQTVSQPVPTKVMSEMRACGAAIIHVEDERRLIDKEGNEQVVLNDNVLIEIGAAMALFGERFILVVKDGVRLPSNLQGLLVLPYKGTTLDMEETVKLMEAINDMKQRKLPGQ
jgi:predicted nucleotide-binding protein